MQLHELINTFGQDLKQRHGQKIHKLSIHGAFTCPNRDGTLGRGGCTFCNVSSFADESAQQLSVVQQLLARRDEVTRARRYLAYFQAYTSTYAEVEYLQRMYEEALSVSDMVGLCVELALIVYPMRCWICLQVIRPEVTRCGWSSGCKVPTTRRCNASIGVTAMPPMLTL